MEVLKIAGVLLLCAVCALILKRVDSPMYAAAVCAGALGALYICLPKISDIVDTVVAIANDSGSSEYFPIVLKVAAASLICDFAADVCSGCDSPDLAKAVTVAGKFEIIFISLPLFTELYRLAVSFLREP